MIQDNIILISFLFGIFMGYLSALMQMENNKQKKLKKAIKRYVNELKILYNPYEKEFSVFKSTIDLLKKENNRLRNENKKVKQSNSDLKRDNKKYREIIGNSES